LENIDVTFLVFGMPHTAVDWVFGDIILRIRSAELAVILAPRNNGSLCRLLIST